MWRACAITDLCVVFSSGPVVSVNVPPELPEILKRYTKAAIKTQPSDVLAWSAA